MLSALAAVVIASTPAAAPTVRLSTVLFVLGEASYAPVGGTVRGYKGVPVLAPATSLWAEAMLQQPGWGSRLALSAAGLGLQGLGLALMGLEALEDEKSDEGQVDSLRVTTVGFRLVEAGGVVTVSGVTF